MSWEQARTLLNSPDYIGDGERPCRLADKYSTAEEMVGLVLNDLVSKRPIKQDGGRTDSWSAKGKSCATSPERRLKIKSQVARPASSVSTDLQKFTYMCACGTPGGQNGTKYSGPKDDRNFRGFVDTALIAHNPLP